MPFFRLLFVLLTLHPLWTAGHEVTSGGSEVIVPLPATARQADAIITLSWRRNAIRQPAYLSAAVITTDDRRFTLNASRQLDTASGSCALPLTAAQWSGTNHPLSTDAQASLRAIALRLDGPAGTTAQLALKVTVPRKTVTTAPPVVRIGPDAWRRHGAWTEWHLEIIADQPVKTVSLAGEGRKAIPAFLHQPGSWSGGTWIAVGTPRWVVRLRPDEGTMKGAAIVVDGTTVCALPERQLTTMTRAPRRQQTELVGDVIVLDGAVRHQPGQPATVIRSEEAASGQFLAPQLSWQEAWTGFRGPRLINHTAAALLDEDLAAGSVTGIDLLPDRLFKEHETFRFGLSPWHRDQGGPWQDRHGIWAAPSALTDLRAHALELVARCRAAPGLDAWLIGTTAAANADRSEQALDQFIADLVQTIHAVDDRPVWVPHPQTRPYASSRLAFDFERHNQGWHPAGARFSQLWEREPEGPSIPGRRRPGSSRPAGSPPAIPGHSWSRLLSSDQASQGRRSLKLDLPVGPSTTECSAGAQVAWDTSLFDDDRLECDVLFRGCGMATIYIWLTDGDHHWYQQRAAFIRPSDSWQRIGVDLHAGADWQPAGHHQTWTPAAKRRVRMLGISAYHLRPGPERVKPTTMHIDNIRIKRWPRLPAVPSLIGTIATAPTQVDRWQTWTTTLRLNQLAANPYDPEEVRIDCTFRGPAGQTIVRPAFWHVDHHITVGPDSHAVGEAQAGTWRVNFAPPTAGTWRWQFAATLRWRDRTLRWTGAEEQLQVNDAPVTMLPVRRSADPRWWETSDGKFFYPIGINLRSPDDERQDALLANLGSSKRSHDYGQQGLAAYRDWFDDLQANGMNYARVWMCPWWCGLEWTKAWNGFGGVTAYNQRNAAVLDAICAMAADRGIYLQIELQNHGMTSPHIDHQWELSPYNRANGGYLDDPAAMFSDKRAFDDTMKRHRYVLARWGHLSHIMAWVLSSEMEFTGDWYANAYSRGYNDSEAVSQATVDWIERSIAWLKQHDYVQRPVSVHFSHPWRAQPVWRLPGIGFGNSNVYTGFQTDMDKLGGRQAGLASGFHYYITKYMAPWDKNHPAMLGEWGGHWAEKRSYKLDAELRTGVWLQANLPFAGNVGFWWWLWCDAGDRWHHFANVARYTADDDPRGQDYKPYRPEAGNDKVWIYGMKGTTSYRLYGWIRGLDRSLKKEPIANAGTFIVQTGKVKKQWRVQRWNCDDGTIIKTRTLTSDSKGRLTISIGRLAPDAAWKIDLVQP